MTSDNITEDELHDLLTSKYKCRRDGTGKTLPAPYCSLDDLPTYYITPLGLFFSVPAPPNGQYYTNLDVLEIIDAARLNVVNFEAKRDKF